jgi:hypothetical protein
MMVIYGLPGVPKIQTTKTRMIKFYKHLMGKNCAQRVKNPPTTDQLRHVENAAWAHMANQLATEDEDVKTLDDALRLIINDGNFWQNNLYEYCNPSSNPPYNQPYNAPYNPNDNTPWYGRGNPGRGKGKYARGNPARGNPGRGKGKYGNKGNKGPYGKGKTDQSNNLWAGRRDYTDPTKNHPAGQQVCRKFHLYGATACYGNCQRDHSKCPNKKEDGTWCNQNHPAYKCTHKN